MQMRRPLILLLCLCAIAAGAWSCGNNSVYPEENGVEPKDESGGDFGNAFEVELQLHSFENGDGSVTRVPSNQIVTLSLDISGRKGTAVGNVDCHTFQYSYAKGDSGSIQFTQLKITNEPCAATGIGTAFLDALRNAQSFGGIEGSRGGIKIYYGKGKALVLIPRRPYFIEDVAFPCGETLKDITGSNNAKRIQWRLQSVETFGTWVGDSSTVVLVPDNQVITLTLQQSPSVLFSGWVDCQPYVCGYRMPESFAISMHPILATDVLPLQSTPCGAEYLTALQSMSYYEIDPARGDIYGFRSHRGLSIYCDNSRKLLNFVEDKRASTDKTLEQMVGTTWEIEQMSDSNGDMVDAATNNFHATLSIEAGRITGKSKWNCNVYSCDYTLYPDNFVSMSNFTTSDNLCPGNSALETQFRVLLQAAVWYTVENGKLVVLCRQDGIKKLIFTK